MKPNKECVNTIFNLIIEYTQFTDKDIKQLNFDEDAFLPNHEPNIFLSNIIQACCEFSPEEIKTALYLLENEKLISLDQNENGRIEYVSLTPYGYSKILRDLLSPSDKCN